MANLDRVRVEGKTNPYVKTFDTFIIYYHAHAIRDNQ